MLLLWGPGGGEVESVIVPSKVTGLFTMGETRDTNPEQPRGWPERDQNQETVHTVWTQAQWRGPEDPGRRPKNSREVSGQSVVVVSHTQYLICFGRRGPTVSGFAGMVQRIRDWHS